MPIKTPERRHIPLKPAGFNKALCLLMVLLAVMIGNRNGMAEEPPVPEQKPGQNHEAIYEPSGDPNPVSDAAAPGEVTEMPPVSTENGLPVYKMHQEQAQGNDGEEPMEEWLSDQNNQEARQSFVSPNTEPEETASLIERSWPKIETLAPETLPPSLATLPVERPALDAIRAIQPEYTRALTAIETGRNDANPQWSPDGGLVAFERGVGDRRKIIVANRHGGVLETIDYQIPEENPGMDIFFPGIAETVSYTANMSWSSDSRSMAFMSNGGGGNYDLYLLSHLSGGQPDRLTRHPGKDSHPHWSPAAGRLAFVSGRTGKANIFTMDLVTRRATQVTRGPKMYLYPQWSPDGSKIAMIYGSNENHDIYVIEDLSRPFDSIRALADWPYDDLRPVWSPDGEKIAFYSNYNAKGDQKTWCIIVIPADGILPTPEHQLTDCIVAGQVVPDIEQGPAWMPDSRHIVFVKNDEQAFNPIYMVNVDDRATVAIETGTKMNHDITCATDGTLAFRTQVEQWDHIYVAKVIPEP